MSPRLPFVVLLLFLLFVCCTCGPAWAAGGPWKRNNTVRLFVAGETRVPKRPGEKEPSLDVRFFEPLFFVRGDGVAVAFVKAQHTEAGGETVDVVARYIETEKWNWGDGVIEGDGANWRTQLVTRRRGAADHVSALGGTSAVARGNKIYLLTVKYRGGDEFDVENLNWEFELSVGEVRFAIGRPGKTIDWETPRLALSTLTEQVKNHSLYLLSHSSSALVTEDKTILFVFRALRGDKYVFVIVRLRDSWEEKQVDWSYVNTTENCYSCSFVRWEEKILMFPSYCWRVDYKVNVSTDAGRTWKNAAGSISRLSDHLTDKEYFTTATIENKTTLLYTEKNTRGTGVKMRYEVQLWFSDGNRVHNAGLILFASRGATLRDLMYTNDELFSLHYRVYKASDNIFLMRHKNLLKRIKSVLRTWVKNDKYLSKSCSETAPQGASPETLCVTPMPTDGLVGFLSDRGNESHWKDEYLLMNAKVRGGTKVTNGFRFRGAGEGAQWPVGQQHLGKRYSFAKYGLTVVATVTIEGVPESDRPLLTVGGAGEKDRVGLWYRKNKQWKVMFKSSGSIVGSSMFPSVWEVNRAYRVALTLYNNRCFAYVDGKLVGEGYRVSTSKEVPLEIDHLFIGEYKTNDATNTAVYVKVTNVFLYNRPFNDTELEALGERL